MGFYGGGFDTDVRNKMDQLLDETHSKDSKTDEIIQLLKDLQTKLDRQGKTLTNIAMYVSKLHHEGKMNQETFDKMDEFLKDYYDDSDLTKDY